VAARLARGAETSTRTESGVTCGSGAKRQAHSTDSPRSPRSAGASGEPSVRYRSRPPPSYPMWEIHRTPIALVTGFAWCVAFWLGVFSGVAAFVYSEALAMLNELRRSPPRAPVRHPVELPLLDPQVARELGMLRRTSSTRRRTGRCRSHGEREWRGQLTAAPRTPSPGSYAVACAPTSASRLPMVCIFRRAVFSSSRFLLSNFATSSSPIASAIVTRPS
jgi:hypothetical protein